MSTVRKLLEAKGDTKVYTVAATDTVLTALQVMADSNTGAVLVARDDKIVGIFTERDYAREGEVKGRCAKETIVGDVMTKELVSVMPETTIQQCAELMAKYHVRHLPVVENERIVGVISLRRLAEGLLEDQKSTIVELENYILGTGYGR
jgi:CBS domain-containing protein